MSDETRFVLIKPGDVLLIGGVRLHDPDTAVNAVRHFTETIGVSSVLMFEDEIVIDKIPAEELRALAGKSTAHRHITEEETP